TEETNNINFKGENNPLAHIGQINRRYQPWPKNPYASDPTLDGQIAVKDSWVIRSDAWDFPTNKYPNIGWLGRVHRGTPWQTLFLKSTNVLLSVGRDVGSMKSSLYRQWRKWTGNPIGIPNIGLISTNYYSLQNPFLDPNTLQIPDATFS